MQYYCPVNHCQANYLPPVQQTIYLPPHLMQQTEYHPQIEAKSRFWAIFQWAIATISALVFGVAFIVLVVALIVLLIFIGSNSSEDEKTECYDVILPSIGIMAASYFVGHILGGRSN